MGGPFSRFRQSRADRRELGEGLWRRAHDRYTRALSRYGQGLQAAVAHSGLTAEQLNGVAHAGAVLEDTVPRVRAVCVLLQERFPAPDDQRIPPATLDVHRQLSRAAHELAATAQALTMYRLGQGTSHSVGAHAERTIGFVEQAEQAAAAL